MYQKQSSKGEKFNRNDRVLIKTETELDWGLVALVAEAAMRLTREAHCDVEESPMGRFEVVFRVTGPGGAQALEAFRERMDLLNIAVGVHKIAEGE